MSVRPLNAANIHARVCVCVCMRVRVRVRVPVGVCVCVYIYTYISPMAIYEIGLQGDFILFGVYTGEPYFKKVPSSWCMRCLCCPCRSTKPRLLCL